MRKVLLPFIALSVVVAGCRLSFPGGTTQVRAMQATPVYYKCPMHPHVKAYHPGACPQCNMTLVPVYPRDAAPHTGAIIVSPQQSSMLGIRYATAEAGTLEANTRAVARIVLDESRIAYVQTRLDCYIDEILVKTVGTEVRKGETLLTVYDAESVPAQKEYLDAVASVSEAEGKDYSPEVTAKARATLAAAQFRLEALGFTELQLKTILSAMQPMVKLPIVSPINGVVTDVAAKPREKVMPQALYTIADLTRVWATADIPSADTASINAGEMATLSVPAMQGRIFPAVVDSIVPAIDSVTHTRKVRARIENVGRILLPGMYGELELHGRSRRALLVPREAVLDRGLHQIVFVDRGHGELEPTEVITGQQTEEKVEIVHGLRAGDRVVSSGHFLIDSESRVSYDHPGH